MDRSFSDTGVDLIRCEWVELVAVVIAKLVKSNIAILGQILGTIYPE
jgi:hypothetical protein